MTHLLDESRMSDPPLKPRPPALDLRHLFESFEDDANSFVLQVHLGLDAAPSAVTERRFLTSSARQRAGHPGQTVSVWCVFIGVKRPEAIKYKRGELMKPVCAIMKSFSDSTQDKCSCCSKGSENKKQIKYER